MNVVSCHCEVCESLDKNNLIHVHGVADILNQSVDGILLSMEFAPRLGQIIELSSAKFFMHRSVRLYEVRWTQPEPSLNAYRVGCQLVFEPLHSRIFEK